MDLLPSHELFSTIKDQAALNMIRKVTDDEIKAAMFSIGKCKAPGLDGFTSAFFKKSWSIVGKDVLTPSSITDYRPISCCNVLYKCISKILADRIKDGLKTVVSINQSAFVSDRRISDNILLTQEILHSINQSGPPRCAFKVDIQKAYDTVDWEFLPLTLKGFGFHPIMTCVSSMSFSISINGQVHGYFKGKRGLRQGDPISPYLFTLVMEVLTLILQHATQLEPSFRFHNRCEKQKLINLCFADDLFLFSRGDVKSASLIMRSLDSFKRMFGLVPSVQKSTAFFYHVPQSDCKILVERMEKKIPDWKNKYLSFAGGFAVDYLCAFFYAYYWASVFILLGQVIKDLEKTMRGFLWCQGPMQNGKAKSLGNRRKSLWVDWIHDYHLRGQNFWDVPIRGSWYDMGPLSDFIQPSDIRRGGFYLTSTIADINRNGSWLWPQVWLDKYPNLLNYPPIHLTLNRDELIWKNDDEIVPFSATTVWDSIRLKENHVGWVNIVWFPQCIPRHAFNLWLIMREKLLTQDKILQWSPARRKTMNMMCCSLCVSDYDSHGHLFFMCKYADRVWGEVKRSVNMQHIPSDWDSIVSYLLSKAKSRSISSVLGRDVVAATAYYVWQERNNRLFKNHARPFANLVKVIKDTVGARLWNLKFKKTAWVSYTLEAWNIMGEFQFQDGG
uniref:uncharacterized protein LOC122601271 n=1 Tax=Erigeron canadensis TaxID=72917 RepID=UPI001CB8C484|nr:uncharacterized protein LOC122601271 [Erigeron canadensis]